MTCAKMSNLKTKELIVRKEEMSILNSQLLFEEKIDKIGRLEIIYEFYSKRIRKPKFEWQMILTKKLFESCKEKKLSQQKIFETLKLFVKRSKGAKRFNVQ